MDNPTSISASGYLYISIGAVVGFTAFMALVVSTAVFWENDVIRQAKRKTKLQQRTRSAQENTAGPQEQDTEIFPIENQQALPQDVDYFSLRTAIHKISDGQTSCCGLWTRRAPAETAHRRLQDELGMDHPSLLKLIKEPDLNQTRPEYCGTSMNKSNKALWDSVNIGVDKNRDEASTNLQQIKITTKKLIPSNDVPASAADNKLHSSTLNADEENHKIKQSTGDGIATSIKINDDLNAQAEFHKPEAKPDSSSKTKAVEEQAAESKPRKDLAKNEKIIEKALFSSAIEHNKNHGTLMANIEREKMPFIDDKLSLEDEIREQKTKDVEIKMADNNVTSKRTDFFQDNDAKAKRNIGNTGSATAASTNPYEQETNGSKPTNEKLKEQTQKINNIEAKSKEFETSFIKVTDLTDGTGELIEVSDVL